MQEIEKAGRAKVRFFTDVNKELKAPLLQLQAEVPQQQVPLVRQMLQIIDKYSDKYCIDTGKDLRAQEIDRQLDRLTQLINERMADHINIDELAREMGMSRRKLFGFVKDNTGKSIIEYIRSYRLSCAAKLLLEQNNLTTLQVMYKVGFESQSYFVKAFKQEFGDTPTDFLAKMSKKNAE
jgi:AraC-like DNA-binding protein